MCICSHFLFMFQVIQLTTPVVELMAYVLHARLEHCWQHSASMPCITLKESQQAHELSQPVGAGQLKHQMAAAPAVAAAFLITDLLHRAMQHVVRQKVTLRAHHIHEALNLQLLCLSVVDIVLGQQRSSVTGQKQFQATGDLMRVGLLTHMGIYPDCSHSQSFS